MMKWERDIMDTLFSILLSYKRCYLSNLDDCRDIHYLKLKVAVLKENTLPKLDTETNETLEA